MADVAGDSTERAQLLIVGAIGLAVLLIVLSLAVNTAVYGEVHVSETDNTLHEEREAIRYQESVRRGVEGFLTDEEDITESELNAELETWHSLTRNGSLHDGVVTDVSITDSTVESRIKQDDEQEFRDDSGSADWTVAGDVERIDEFELELHEEELAGDCESAGDCFSITVEGGGENESQLFVHSPDHDTIELEVENATGETQSCTVDSPPATVDLVDGEDCSFGSFSDDLNLDPPYNVTYANAGNVTGTYNLTVRGAIPDDGRFAEEENESPRVERTVVGATVSVSYRSPDLTYENAIRVYPGENDD